MGSGARGAITRRSIRSAGRFAVLGSWYTSLRASVPQATADQVTHLPSSHSRLTASTLAGFLALVAPAGAAAPASIAPLKRCYVSVAAGSTEPVLLSAAGFAAGAAVDVRLDGAPVATMGAGRDGRLNARVFPPHQRRGQRSFRIELQQRDDPSHRVAVTARVTALEVTLRPRAADPRSVVTWTGRGFTARGPVFVHYVKDGQVHSTVRLGVPRGPCGTFRLRRPQFRFQPSLGTWTLQIDQQRAYAPVPATPFVRLPVTVRRVP